jgi:hypothetical protein
MTKRYATLPFLAILALRALPQAPLSALGIPITIDFTTTVPGVNNGLFGADSDMGQVAPFPGQLDLDAWDYFADGTIAQASGNAGNFPGMLPVGNGYYDGGSFVTGVNATDINGQRCFGIQPTGGHFTAGSLTLRAVNNTGQAINRLDVEYLVHVFNDRDRSNALRFYYSTSNTAGSYVAVPSAEVVSPLDLDAAPQWATTPVSFSITGISVPAGGFIHLRWVGDDVAGSGQRDEFAIGPIVLTAQVNSGPVLLASTTGLPPFTQDLGTPSAPQSFTVSGSNLIGEVAMTVSSPFELALSAGGPYLNNIELDPVAGALPETTVYVRLNSDVPGPVGGSVSVTSPGANILQVNLTGNTVSGSLPQILINELQASNLTTITDDFGEYGDWFELFNPNPVAVDLAGWYVSDDPANPTKYQFAPSGTDAVVPAGGWLLVWADNQSAQGNLHTNFALSSTNGENVVLTGPDGITIVDQIAFGPQDDDVSFGRATDGGLPWVEFAQPTPGASNNPVGVAELNGSGLLRAWPVPVGRGPLFLSRTVTADVLGPEGRIAARITNSNVLDAATLAPGAYVLRTVEGEVLRFVRE